MKLPRCQKSKLPCEIVEAFKLALLEAVGFADVSEKSASECGLGDFSSLAAFAISNEHYPMPTVEPECAGQLRYEAGCGSQIVAVCYRVLRDLFIDTLAKKHTRGSEMIQGKSLGTFLLNMPTDMLK